MITLNKSDFMNLKTIILAGGISAMSTLAMGQARETTLTVGKDKINAVKMEVDAPSTDVQKALQSQFSGTATKPKKGPASSYTYNDVVLPAVSQDTVDVWTRVQKNGNRSVIYMAVKDQQGNYLSGGGDSSIVEKVKDFLYDFARAQNYSSRDLEIGSLMDSVSMDQTGFEKYTSERARIEGQIRELQSQLQTMEQGFNTSRTEMERRKQRLDELRSSSETGEAGGNAPTKGKKSKSGSGTEGTTGSDGPSAKSGTSGKQ